MSDESNFIRRHWKWVTGISVAITVIVILVVVLVLTLANPNGGYVFHGPPNINGNALRNLNQTYAFPQIIQNPTPNTMQFGQQMFIHEAGYICCVVNTPTGQTLNFYYTDINGVIQGPQIIPLDFLPANMVVCNGAFAPIFNYANEVYYLFLSVGVTSAAHQGFDFTNLYATHLILFSLNTFVTFNAWQQSNIQSQYSVFLQGAGGNKIKAMKIPISAEQFIWKSTTPWQGTFGDKLQIVVDNSSSFLKHSLYVSGSQYSSSFPGGSLYWFILTDNQVSPNLILESQIQDAKLAIMYAQGLYTYQLQTPEDYINGFASSFYVTSGLGLGNILIIANNIGEDNAVLPNSQQPAAPNGYIQGYTFSITDGWMQSQTSPNTFDYRFIPVGDPSVGLGWGYGCLWVQNTIVVGQSELGNANYLVYAWPSNGNKNPIINGAMPVVSTISTTLAAAIYYPSPDFPYLRYNVTIRPTNDGSTFLCNTFNRAGPNDQIAVINPLGDPSSPYTKFTIVQSFGAVDDSNLLGQALSTHMGYGQYVGTWLSKTQSTVRLALNDPWFQNGLGRIIVYTKNRA